jgi:hypothetical protein
VADHDDFHALSGKLLYLYVNLGHQRAGGIEDLEFSGHGMVSNLSRDPVGTHDHSGTERNLVKILYEHCALLAKVSNHMVVVDNLMPDINGGAESLERPLDNLNGAVHTGTKTPRFREKNLHFIHCSHG